jgi:hypothetical protein
MREETDDVSLELVCPIRGAACYDSSNGSPLATFRYTPLETLVARVMAKPHLVELLSSHVDHVCPTDDSVAGIWGTLT